jgi:hypothetical protein
MQYWYFKMFKILMLNLSCSILIKWFRFNWMHAVRGADCTQSRSVEIGLLMRWECTSIVLQLYSKLSDTTTRACLLTLFNRTILVFATCTRTTCTLLLHNLHFAFFFCVVSCLLHLFCNFKLWRMPQKVHRDK